MIRACLARAAGSCALILAGAVAPATGAIEPGRPLATFETGIEGETTGARGGPSLPGCRAEDIAAPDGPAAVELLGASLGIAPAEGRTMLRLRTSPDHGRDDLAQSRWTLPIETEKDGRLSLSVAFVTTDRAGYGDWFAVLVDGEVLRCGDTRTELLALKDVLENGDRSTGWLAGGATLAAGSHLLEIVVGDGTDSTGDSSILVDDVRIEPIPMGDPCRPLPPEDVGEIPYDTAVPPDETTVATRWVFDDNRFCSAGPELGCRRCLSGPPPPCAPGDPIVDPNSGFTNSTGLSFQMYIVADCGTSMHLPLYDVESGCISILDSDGTPFLIRARNGTGFDETDTEVCWNALDCSGSGNNPGGPGNERTMDVSFEGQPTLCGVYVANFRSWAGCIWDLFANCNGTNNAQFDIYKDICEAADAFTPLPEIIVESLTLTDAGNCRVGYCATIRNIGCQAVSNFTVRIQNATAFNNRVVLALGAGQRVTICGSLAVDGNGPAVPTTVTAIADSGNALVECTEVVGASSCDPETGSDSLSVTRTIDCAEEPRCEAGGPYLEPCVRIGGTVAIQLDGTGSFDPGGGPLTYAWTTDCPGGVFDDPASATPVLLLPPGCLSCFVSLTVTDQFGVPGSCLTDVTVTDSLDPVLAGVPPDGSANCASVPPPPIVTATDSCDPAPVVQFVESRTDLVCPDNYRLVRTWTATDSCGNSASATQVITVTNNPPQISGIPPDVQAECPAVPPIPTPIVSDDCDPNPQLDFVETSAPGPCPGTLVLTRTWTVTDRCGAIATATQVARVVDTTPPTLNVPANKVVECPAPAGGPDSLAAWVASASATDTCGPAHVGAQFVGVAPGCGATSVTTYEFTAFDDCGNGTAPVLATYAVVDTTPPVVTAPANKVVECPADAGGPDSLAAWIASATSSDTCSPSHVDALLFSTTPGCGGTTIATYDFVAVDDCLNRSGRVRATFTTIDTTPPALAAPADKIVECPAPAGGTDSLADWVASATSSDTCSPSHVEALLLGTVQGCGGTSVTTYEFVAVDDCANMSAPVLATHAVVDTTPPSLVAPADKTVECPAPPSGPDSLAEWVASASASDSCAGSHVDAVLVDTVPGCGGTSVTTYEFVAVDDCANRSAPVRATYAVVDTTPPTLVAPADKVVECPAPPSGPDSLADWIASATSSDSCAGSHVDAVLVDTLPGCGGTSVTTYEFVAVDDCANRSAPVRATYSVVDTTPPSLVAPSDKTVECPAPPSGPDSENEWLASATASDACAGALVMHLLVQSDDLCGNTFRNVHEFWAVDACGLESAHVQRTYLVEDTTPPQIVPPDDKTVECPAPPSGPDSEDEWLASATATDGCGAPRVMHLLVQSDDLCGNTFRNIHEFWAVDECGLESAHVRRTYEVVDTLPPELFAPADLTVECPPPASGPGSEDEWLASATATDECGTARVLHRLVETIPGCGSTFTNVHEFWAVDECDLESARVLRSYVVVDTLPPEFSLSGDQFAFSIWPPNHGYVVYSTADVVSASDACGAVTVQATGCASSQPEEVHQGRTDDGGNGDGRTFEDCVVSVDGSQFAVRAERLGACGRDSMRIYTVEFTATDECGNTAPGQGSIVVEHDRSGHQPVRRGRKLGPNDPPPFPYIHPTIYGPGC